MNDKVNSKFKLSVLKQGNCFRAKDDVWYPVIKYMVVKESNCPSVYPNPNIYYYDTIKEAIKAAYYYGHIDYITEVKVYLREEQK